MTTYVCSEAQQIIDGQMDKVSNRADVWWSYQMEGGKENDLLNKKTICMSFVA